MQICRHLGKPATAFLLFLGLSSLSRAQSNEAAQKLWSSDEIENILGGITIDVSPALEILKKKNITPYDFGKQLLSSGKSEEARSWYEALTKVKNDPQYFYGLAMTLWKMGDNKGALKSSLFLLKKKPPAPPPIIQARNLYLLSLIYMEDGQYEKSQQYALECFNIYAHLGKDGGRFLATMQQAWIAVAEERFDSVEEILDQAYEYNELVRKKGKKPYSRGDYHELLSESLFRQGDIEGALREAQSAEAEYESAGHLHQADYMQAKVGLFKLLTGEVDGGYNIALGLWKKHKDSKRSRLLALNAITFMKFALCSQEEKKANEMETSVRSWAAHGPGANGIIKLLEYVKSEINMPCPERR